MPLDRLCASFGTDVRIGRGTLRQAQGPNASWFLPLADARERIEDWRGYHY